MGEVTSILDLLQKENPKESRILLEVFSDALSIYLEASRNIKANGAIVAHPRTGAPIENPYLKIQTQKGAVLTSYARVKTETTLKALES